MKVTLDQVMATIAKEETIRVGETTTIVALTLKNGYVVTGQSACVDPAEYDATIGTKLAREKAIDKIWELEGYLLATTRSTAATNMPETAFLKDDTANGHTEQPVA